MRELKPIFVAFLLFMAGHQASRNVWAADEQQSLAVVVQSLERASADMKAATDKFQQDLSTAVHTREDAGKTFDQIIANVNSVHAQLDDNSQNAKAIDEIYKQYEQAQKTSNEEYTKTGDIDWKNMAARASDLLSRLTRVRDDMRQTLDENKSLMNELQNQQKKLLVRMQLEAGERAVGSLEVVVSHIRNFDKSLDNTLNSAREAAKLTQ